MAQLLSNFGADLTGLRQGASCAAREKTPSFLQPIRVCRHALATRRRTASDIAEVHPRRMQGRQAGEFHVLLRRNRSHIAKFPSISDQVIERSVSLCLGSD